MRILSVFLFLIILKSCANIVAPSGGEKDVNAPEIQDIKIVEKSNFKIIEFKFNEYIQLNQWEKNFYISPPIKNIVTKTIKGKSLFLTIKDSLNIDLTYYISLNHCVKDNNEGNILEDLNYLYSFSLYGISVILFLFSTYFYVKRYLKKFKELENSNVLTI